VSDNFSFPVRVYYEDTDAGGVVFYANYLKFMERARTEWLRQMGIEQDVLTQEQAIVFAVRRIKVDYLKPARFNEQLDVTVQVKKCNNASLDFYQEVRRAGLKSGEVLCKADVQIACVDVVRFVPRRIPENIIMELKNRGV